VAPDARERTALAKLTVSTKLATGADAKAIATRKISVISTIFLFSVVVLLCRIGVSLQLHQFYTSSKWIDMQVYLRPKFSGFQGGEMDA